MHPQTHSLSHTLQNTSLPVKRNPQSLRNNATELRTRASHSCAARRQKRPTHKINKKDQRNRPNKWNIQKELRTRASLLCGQAAKETYTQDERKRRTKGKRKREFRARPIKETYTQQR